MVHPLDSWQLTAAGLEESEINAARAERIRRQRTLDNDLAEQGALRRRPRASVPRLPVWLRRAAWVVAMAIGVGLLIVGLMVF